MRRRPIALALAVVAAATTAAPLLAGPATAAAGPRAVAAAPLPETISADTLPTPQVNGTVYSIAIVGKTAYAAGRFTKARPAGVAVGGAGEVARTNLLAFDLTTGALLPFSHTITAAPFTSTTNPGPFCESTGVTNQWVCTSVFRVKPSADGSKLYLAGDFTSVDGASRPRVAAIDLTTGLLDQTFKPALSSRVRGLAVGTSAVYVAGSFSSAAGVARTRVAGFDLTGKVITGFAPSVDKDAWSAGLTADGAQLVVGGQFDTANAVTQHGIVAFQTADGSLVSWPQIFPPGDGSVITDLAIDGGTAYASGFAYTASNPGNLEGRMALDIGTGRQLWADSCRGDSQSLALAGGVIYSASHNHMCTAIGGWPQLTPVTYQRIVAETAAVTGLSPIGQPVPSVLPVFPNTDGGPSTSPFQNGPWAVAADGTNVVYGGEFLTVNGSAQQGLTRFVVRSAAPRKSGPQSPFPAPTVASQQAGSARVMFQTTTDRDDPTLTYTVLRNGVAVKTLTAGSSFWHRPVLTWTDTGLTPGSSVVYRVRVTDSDGNTLTSPSAAAVTVASGPTTSGYAAAVVADGAAHYWRLGDPAGSATGKDRVGTSDLALATEVTTGLPGAVTADADTSAYLGGASTSPAVDPVKETSGTATSVEAWFSTTSQFGGELAGMGSAATGTSTTTDRILYLTNEGRVAFGAGSAATTPAGISSRLTYNDGLWHHAVATLGAAGAALYVDGLPVAADPKLTPAAFLGYWRLGGDRLSAWPGVASSTPTGRGFPWPTRNSFTGSLDDVAVYPVQLSAAQASAHYLLGAPEPGVVPSLAGATVRLSPTDDATISALNPTTTYGTAKTLTVDVDQLMQDFVLKFPVPATCTPVSATLTLTVGAGSTNASVYGGDLYAAPDNGWAESTVTYVSAPVRTGTPVSLATPVVASTAYPVDVTPLLAAAVANGTVGLRAGTPSKDAAAYVSRNAGTSGVPTLAVTCQ